MTNNRRNNMRKVNFGPFRIDKRQFYIAWAVWGIVWAVIIFVI